MKLYNTQSRSIEDFQPLHDNKVTFYSCGPTVYDYAHIGHARKYTHDDLLQRALSYFGYNVDHVMNITDVGHLESDGDEGEDKLEKGATKHDKTVMDVAQFFTDDFFTMTDALNIQRPNTIAKATDHIQEMIELIKRIIEKGAAYETDEAVYFDTSRFNNYGKLSGQALDEKKQKARDDVHVDPQKKNPADFALWFKRVGRFKSHSLHWNSPWGDGFPGWHIECSAMSMKYLGETIDIHSGGVDHIPVHHENEIAQSECATGKQFVRFWFHSEFLMIEGEKMSKSLGNLLTIKDIQNKGIDPTALRYLFLQTHYRQLMNFTWDALDAAHTALQKLRNLVVELQQAQKRPSISDEKLNKVTEHSQRFQKALANDLQMPQALAILWKMAKSNIPSSDKLEMIYDFDRVFGLDLQTYKEESIPENIVKLAEDRHKARKKGDYTAADSLRKKITEKGYTVKDTSEGFTLKQS